MIEERILSIVSTIVRIIATAKPEDDLDARIYSELVAGGFSATEITEAFAVFSKVIGRVRMSAAPAADDLVVSGIRSITPSEAIRMSSDALGLFHKWQGLRLLTASESEEILRQVMLADTGCVEIDDLLRFAESSASFGSLLGLYLAAETSASH